MNPKTEEEQNPLNFLIPPCLLEEGGEVYRSHDIR